MSRVPVRVCALLAFAAFGAGSPERSVAQGPKVREQQANDKLRKKLEDAKANHEQALKRAKGLLVRAYDAFDQSVKKARMDSEQRAQLRDQIRRGRAALVEHDTIPREEEMTEALFIYAQAIHVARTNLRRAFNDLFNQANKADDLDLLRELTDEKATLDRELVAIQQFRAGTKWDGSHLGMNGGTVSLRLNVNQMDGNAFRGTAEQDYQIRDNDTFKISGKLDGTYITWKIDVVTVGRPRTRSYEGYLVGDRILGTYKGMSVNNTPNGGHFRLTKN